MKKILIIEDELIIATANSLYLKQEGYNVVGIASSGKKALDEIKKSDPDLILMDIQLKGKLNGLEVAREIRLSKNTPILFTTGNSMIETEISTGKISHTSILIKPVDFIELKNSIQNLLQN